MSHRAVASRSLRRQSSPIDTSVLLAIDVSQVDSFVQHAAESFVKNLVVRTAVGIVLSWAAGSVVRTFQGAFEAGKDRALSGDVNFNMLYLAIFIDLIGDSSYLIPGLGETEDVLWAPLSALAVSALFGKSAGALDFVKEILPFSDALPVATLAWLLQNIYPDSAPAKLFGLSNDDRERNKDGSS